ncbi:MAG: hypothetical protein IPM25_16650 [Chloracidobacterium sp.]|nr:hypothetical protein [Chloracidobacterium sp.]
MKNSRNVILMVAVLIFCIAISSLTLAGLQAREALPIEIELTPAKSNYMLGEVVHVVATIRNSSDVNVLLPRDVFDQLQLQISMNGISYANYIGKARGLQIEDANEIEVGPGEKIDYTYRMLWNSKPQVSHLNADAAERMSKGRILTNFAFPEKGTYYVRAVLTAQKLQKRLFESEPVRIVISMPAGDDLKVWKTIERNPEIAYFLQEGDFPIPTYKFQERAGLVEDIQELIQSFPHSSYTMKLTDNLDRFRVVEQNRKAGMCKLNPSLEQCRN